jgi:hypothetical protein
MAHALTGRFLTSDASNQASVVMRRLRQALEPSQ